MAASVVETGGCLYSRQVGNSKLKIITYNHCNYKSFVLYRFVMLRQFAFQRFTRPGKLNFALGPFCIKSVSNDAHAETSTDSFGNLEAPLEPNLRQKWIHRAKFSPKSISKRETNYFGNLNSPLERSQSTLTKNETRTDKPRNRSHNTSVFLEGTAIASPDSFGNLDSPLELNLKPHEQVIARKNARPEKPRKSWTNNPSDNKKCYVSTTGNSSLKEAQNFTKSKNADVFGELAKDDPKFKMVTITEREFPDDNDPVPSQTFIPDVKRKRFVDYSQDIRKLSKEGKLKEAIELFESLDELGVAYQQETLLFTNIIAACGRHGYTKKAFQIYRKVRDHGLKPTGPMLTALFNACGECPFPEYGLQKAQTLYVRMNEEGWQANQKSYHAMIKAFGRCGDLATAFLLVDKMKEQEISITDRTFGCLLQACISNKDAGFSHAISVFRKMRKMRIKPSLFNYNLLLRATRDCGVGSPEISSKLILDWFQEKPRLAAPQKKFFPLNTSNNTILNNDTETNSSKNAETQSFLSKLPDGQLPANNVVLHEVVVDILSARSEKTDIVALGEIKTSKDRLALLGGASRILNKLEFLNQKANIQTFTLLLECQESTVASEDFLLEQMDIQDLKPDIDFFNVLIKKRCFRNDYKNAVEVTSLMNKYGLYPDIATYGTLAMACKSRNKSTMFLNDMENAGSRPNIQVAGTILKNACYAVDFGWIMDTMSILKKHQIKPDEKFLQLLEEAWKKGMKLTIELEKDYADVPAWAQKFKKEKYKQFCLGYKNWLKSVQMDITQHPWTQFEPDPSEERK